MRVEEAVSALALVEPESASVVVSVVVSVAWRKHRQQ